MASAVVTNTNQTQGNGCTRSYYYYYYYHYYYLWMLTWAAVWAFVRGAWPKEGECTPCNSIVEADNLTLPFVGFVCMEEAALLHPPSTCLVSFRGDFNLTFYLHHVPSTLVSVTLCATVLDYYDELPPLDGLLEEFEKVNCDEIERYRKYEDLQDPVDLNITTLPAHPHRPPRPHAFTALHTVPEQHWRGGINLTYELQRLEEKEEVVGGEDFAHAEGCNYNGVPVLQKVSPRKYKFECQCGLNASGDHCHQGGQCIGRAQCQGRGHCRYIAGESLCICYEGYRGVNCSHHYTSIPARDTSCGGLQECHHQCHLQVLSQEKVALCSCRAGYRLVNRTQCVPQDEWDVTVVIEVGEDKSGGGDGEREGGSRNGALLGYTNAEAVNTTLKVLAACGAAAYDRNLSVSSRSRRVEALVKVNGAALARRLADISTWRLHFTAAKQITSTVAPQLSIGPVGAQWVDDFLVLRCPVYGGPHLRFTWYKDGNLVLDHHVTNCSYDSRTRKLHILTKRGPTEYSCVEEMWVKAVGRVDGGTYLCRVEDRGYRASREVVAGSNESLVLLLQPRVVTVHRGENVTVSCITKNRLWVKEDHYLAYWSHEPSHAFAGLTHAILPRRGYSITFFGVAEAMKVKCTMLEKEGMVWDAGREEEGLEEASVEGEVHVVTPATPTCPQEQSYGIMWPLTSVGVSAHELCPAGFKGEGVTRACHAPDPSSPATWHTPDFSACVRRSLAYLMTPLFLYERGYSALPGNTEDVARKLLGTLKEGEPPLTLLPREGTTVLRILSLLDAARRQKEEEEEKQQSQIPLSVFLRVMQVLVGRRDVIRSQDVGEMLRLTRGGVSAAVQDEEVRLADLAARIADVSLSPATGKEYPVFLKVEQPVVEEEKEEKEGSAGMNRSVAMKVSVRVEASPMPPTLATGDGVRSRRSIREHLKEEDHVEEEEEEDNEGDVRVGVVVYLHPDTFLPHSRERAILSTYFTVDWQVASPWVEVVVVAGESTAPSTRTPTNTTSFTTTSIISTTTDRQLSVISQLWFSSSSCFSCPESEAEKERSDGGKAEWKITCARLQVTAAGVLQVYYGACSPVTEGVTGGRVCTCRGEGLFGLLQVSKTPVEIKQKENEDVEEDNKEDKMKDDESDENKDNKDTPTKEEEEEEEKEKQEKDGKWSFIVMVVCVLSAVVCVVCVVLLVPGAAHSMVQLRLLKCVAITALNLALAAFTFWPHSKFVREGVVVVGSASVVLCMGVGVSQQLALHQHLAVTTQTTPLATLTTQTTTLILAGASVMVAVSAWVALPRRRVPPWSPSAPSWLLVGGGNWVAAAVVGGGAGVVTWVWALLAVHNLRKLSFIREATPQHRSVAMVGGRVAQLTGVLTMEWTVLASSLFLHHPLGQYLFCAATLVQSAVSLVLYWGGSGAPCWCLSRHSPVFNPDPGAPQNEGGGGEERGCMGGLMSCSLPSSKTYFGKGGSAPKNYTSEFRGRGGSLWSQTTSTMVASDPADLLPFSTDPIPQGRRDLQLYARCGSSVPSGARRPRNLFLRGTNFLCGEDVTSPQDHSSTGTSLDVDLRAVGRRRELSCSLHQAVIHEVSPAVRGTRSKPSEEKYLDMSVREVAWCSPAHAPGREYVNLEALVSTKVGDVKSSDKEEEQSGYLPMAREWKGRDEQGGACRPTTSAEVTGARVKVMVPVEGAAQAAATQSPPGTSSQSLVVPHDDDPLESYGSSLGTAENSSFVNTDESGDGDTRKSREEIGEAQTLLCSSETQPRKGKTVDHSE